MLMGLNTAPHAYKHTLLCRSSLQKWHFLFVNIFHTGTDLQSRNIWLLYWNILTYVCTFVYKQICIYLWFLKRTPILHQDYTYSGYLHRRLAKVHHFASLGSHKAKEWLKVHRIHTMLALDCFVCFLLFLHIFVKFLSQQQVVYTNVHTHTCTRSCNHTHILH